MSEQAVKDFVFRKGAAMRIPVSGTFELISRCNFRCAMCYIHSESQEKCYKEWELSGQQWLSIGREAVDAGMVYLLLTGGEPLLHPDFLQIYTGLMQMGLRIAINSNGSLITPEIVECFRKYPPEKINISLYGVSKETYAGLCGNAAGYEKAVCGIRSLKEAGIRVNLNTTFTRRNVGDMEQLVAFAKEENLPIRTTPIIFPPVRGGKGDTAENMTPEEMGRMAAEFDWLTLTDEQKEKRLQEARRCKDPDGKRELPSKTATCMAAKGSFWISWDGMMYPCGMLSEKGTDVVREGFAQAWKETVSRSLGRTIPTRCLECPLRQLCPMCAAVLYATGCGPEEVPEDLCLRTKAYLQAILEKG